MPNVDDLHFFVSDPIENAIGESTHRQYSRTEIRCWADFGKVSQPIDRLDDELLDANGRGRTVLAYV